MAFVIHHATIELSDTDRHRYENLTATTARHPSETGERVILRLLAFALFHTEGLEFTKGVSDGDEPDLWSKEGDGRVAEWIEVGLPSAERILKAVRSAGQVRVLAGGKGLAGWLDREGSKLVDHPRISLCTIDTVPLSPLWNPLPRRMNWEVTISGGSCYLTAEGTMYETAIDLGEA